MYFKRKTFKCCESLSVCKVRNKSAEMDADAVVSTSACEFG